MTKNILFFFLGIVFLSSCYTAQPNEVRLLSLAVEQSTADRVILRAAQNGIVNARVLANMSYVIRTADGSSVSIVLGRGQSGMTSRQNSVCFVAVAKADKEVDLLPTIGFGTWETEACVGVAFVGLLRNRSENSSARLGIIFRAASPNFATLEPVVITWRRPLQDFEIDLEASSRASLAGAITIEGISRALQ